MPSSLYLVQCVLGAADGKSQMVIPIKAYKAKDTAEEAMRLRSEVLRQIVSCRIHDPQGDTGVTVAGFLRDLGLHGFNHVVDTISVHESDLLTAPPPSIIIPR
jgi:hypothetical protein